jgi:hypothetical protein
MKYRQKIKTETRTRTRFKEPTNQPLFESRGRRKYGGFHKGSYRGINCDSGWELAFIVFCLDKGIPINRCSECFEYRYNGYIRRFYPDFKIGDVYIEIKGIVNDQVLAKVSYFPRNLTLLVLGKNEMKNILKYVTAKYGLNFFNLYT